MVKRFRRSSRWLFFHTEKSQCSKKALAAESPLLNKAVLSSGLMSKSMALMFLSSPWRLIVVGIAIVRSKSPLVWAI